MRRLAARCLLLVDLDQWREKGVRSVSKDAGRLAERRRRVENGHDLVVCEVHVCGHLCAFRLRAWSRGHDRLLELLSLGEFLHGLGLQSFRLEVLDGVWRGRSVGELVELLAREQFDERSVECPASEAGPEEEHGTAQHDGSKCENRGEGQVRRRREGYRRQGDRHGERGRGRGHAAQRRGMGVREAEVVSEVANDEQIFRVGSADSRRC